MSKWLWQWKWVFVLAIFAGPAFAYYSYDTAQRIERVMASGTPFEAMVTGGSVERGRRGRRTYNLDLQWAGADSVPHNQSFEISSTYANQIFVDDYVNVETVHVRYLPSETAEPLVIVEDAPNRLEDQRFGIWFGIGAGIAGLIISPIWFWLERRFKKKRDNDIDDELARMRGQSS